MFINNVSTYRLQRKLGVKDLNQLNRALEIHKYRAPSAYERATDGFEPPMSKYRDTFALVVGRSELDWHDDVDDFYERPFPFEGFGQPNDCLLLNFYREEKVLVPAFIKRQLRKAVEEAEEADAGRKIYAKERNEMRDTIVQRILPSAQTRYWRVPIMIFSSGLVVIGDVGKKAEEALSALREVLGTFPAVPLRTERDAVHVLTAIAKNEVESRFKVTDDFQMQTPENHPAIARMKNTRVNEDCVQELLEDKLMSHANMSWDGGKVTFKLDYKDVIRKVRIDLEDEDFGQEEEDYNVATATYGMAMIEFDLFNQMLVDKIALFGGEVEMAKADDHADETLFLDLDLGGGE